MTAFPPATRRVGRLRLCAPSHDQARRAATLFEDALRTASLPDAGHGRLVLIRRLNLGRIHPRAGAASFALRLEEVARAAVLRAVPADSAAAATADAVRFRDCAEALAMFARRLARRVPASEWFWPAALPGWSAGLDRSAQWFALLRIAESLPASTLAAAALVREAVAAGALAELLSGLPVGAGTHWLQTSSFRVNYSRRNEAGQSHAADFQTPSPAAAELWSDDDEGRGFIRDHRLSASLSRFAQYADLADDRVLWLVTIAAVADNPRRAADTNLPARANRWLRTIAKEGSHRPGDRGADVHEVSPANPSIGCRSNKGAGSESPAAQPSSIARRAAAQVPDVMFAPEHGTSATPGTPFDGEFTTHDGLHFRTPHQPGDRSSDAHEVLRASRSAGCLGLPGANSESPATRDSSAVCVAARENPGAELKYEHRTSASPDTPPEGEFTAHGGLLFLVPVLDHLGLPEFLAARPAWLEAGYGADLLIAFGARVGLREEDPMARVLRQDEGAPTDAPGFGANVKPANLLYSENDGQPTPDPSQEGNRLSPDRRCSPPERDQGRVGPGAAATRLETRFAAITSVGAPASGPARWDPSPSSRRAGGRRSGSWAGSAFDCNSTALDSPHSTPFTPWISAARRWCRRKARIGLHSLIVRPACVQASATHLDVTFALRLTDLRIRRAGLDFDPGWVPWIGRVVRFHYEDSNGR